jgi:hypothetical protein
MTITTISCGGKDRPLLFGFSALYEYERTTGRNALADLSSMQGGLSASVAIDLAFCAFSCGAKKEKTPVDFDAYDVAEWATETPDLLEKVMTALAESLPTEKKGEKKRAAK